MELECKRRDGSWHPCRISLSVIDSEVNNCSDCDRSRQAMIGKRNEDNAAIIVAYETSEEEEEVEELERIVSREEGLARLRFRSAFLQGGECSRVIEGQRVLASHDASSSNLFFDAIVEKINRVRHSDRLACRCTFSVKWLTNYTQDQKVRVTSVCIMRLSDKSIETHPVVEAFKEPANSSAENGALSFSENLFDVDLNATLENQVDIMDQGADCSKDGIVGLRKVNKKELKNKKSSEPNSDRRVTMNKSKQEIETPLEEAIKRASSNSFLSPLAARAALASVLCTLPVSALSKHLEEFPVSPGTSKGDVGFPFFSPLSAHTHLSPFASALPANVLPKQAKKPPLTPNQLDYNSDTGRTVGVNPGSEKIDPVIPRRITRSAKKQEGVELITDMRETQNRKSRGTEEGNSEAENHSFTTTEDAVRPASTENKKRICISLFASAPTSASIVTTNSILDSEGNGLPKRAKEPTLKPSQLSYNSESEITVTVNPMSEKVDYLIPRRITRSAIKREGVDMMTGMQGTQNEKSRGTEKYNKKSGNSSFPPDVEDIATPVMSEKKKRRCISPIASSATSTSIVTNSISDCEGETCQDAESQAVAKRTKTVFRKPPTRFSVRLAQLDNNIS